LGKPDGSTSTFSSFIGDPNGDPDDYIFDSTVLCALNELSSSLYPSYPFDPPLPPGFPPFPVQPCHDYLHHITSFEALRPRWRWLLVGRKGAGFGMHVDPHATCAWNTLLAGKKRWALLPPSTPSELASPDPSTPARLWFEHQLPVLLSKGLKPVQLEQYPGETIFIPSGWWHVALTVSENFSVAVTCNFMDKKSFEEQVAILFAKSPDAAASWVKRVIEAGLPFHLQSSLANKLIGIYRVEGAPAADFLQAACTKEEDKPLNF